MSTRYRCPCGWEGTEDHMEDECLDHGDRYQPEEWTNRCPDCGRDWEHFSEVPVCRTCEDTYVHDEGDQCEVCRQEQLEMECERMIDDSMLGG